MKPANPSRPLIVLSHHRSGSNFLSEVLQYHPGIQLINEPLSMHTDFFLKQDLIPWAQEHYDDEILHVDFLPHPGVRSLLLDLRDFLRRNPPGVVRGFKETLLFEKLPWFKSFLPEARILYILRDPRSVINSVKKNRMWKIWDYENNIPRFLMQSNLHRYLDLNVADFLATPTGLALLSWKIRYHYAKRYLAAFDNVTVKLEDFLRRTGPELARVMEFIGLDPTPPQSRFVRRSGDATRGKSYSVFRNRMEVLDGWKRGLDRGELRNIESAVGEEMHELGYL